MHVSFLVPSIHDRPTGGNIYNRRMEKELQDRGSTQIISWSPGSDPPEELDLPSEGPVLVDSLLVRHEPPLRALRDAHTGSSFVLLAHYLHCIDPTAQGSAAAEAERKGLPLFDGAITPSHYARWALIDIGVPPDRIAVVPPGLDAQYRAPLPERSSRDVPRLLTVASLLPGKGLHVLVDALSTLADTDWTWTLVGDDTLDPDFADAVADRLRASPIADRVTWTGPVPTEVMREQYDRADVFVLPSRFETCSMAMREAMARGLPVGAFDVGGLSENVGDAHAGVLVSPDAPRALADALRRLLANPAERTEMGQAARARSRVFPSWAEAADRLDAVLRTLQAT